MEQEWIMDYESVPEVTLSSLTEANKEESTTPVRKQRSYTGRGVIPSSLADTLCTDLGVDGVLEKINTILGTSYILDESVISVLNSYVAQNYDFGTAYAYLRPYWKDIHTMEYKLRIREARDKEMRQNVLVHDRITTRFVPPRRVWDLYANRVVLYWVAPKTLWGISHAWVDEKDRASVMTPINQGEWPVPMPKDANLDLIRIEMLNARSKWEPHLEAEYAWLDVLCLRQEDGKNEHLRKDKWKLDVPTIGSVYQQQYSCVVCYFNGLGRPLHFTAANFESDRCWFRRAWTLQEITSYPIIGGETDNDGPREFCSVRRRFDEELTSLQEIRRSRTILELVSEMQHRVSTKPLDKVAGLVYLLKTDSIPIYDVEQSAADAWEVLVDVMRPELRAQLLFFYPEPGNGKKCWRPSWEQVMSNKVIAPGFTGYPGMVCRTDNPDADYYEGYHIESGNVRGLSEVPRESWPRQGELVLKDVTGEPHTLKIVADHGYPIPDGVYTLIGWYGFISGSELWVVGQLREDGMFQKLSVFCSAADEQARLRHLGIEKTKIVLC
ncbi:hypothetical protein ARMSODRAFT_943371 [Armillaria solidipes]|uniref:Heterokaryon incompatibility domain-containing protein n=1 Tax=Armillaria solidipes TaxID=1076256 RepID=A0A2H3ATD3_9AGAR|nr:hypothetical protein ARMSODRAFT_943371 [Armillaria solidipes]